jgi:hypothetical protein
MKIYPAKTVTVFCILLCGSLLVNCGGGSTHTVTLNQILVSPANKFIPKGTKLSLTATGMYSDGSSKDLTTAVAWQASPVSVATINAQGSLSGVAIGRAQIAAVYEEVTGNAAVIVSAAALSSIAIGVPKSSLPEGETEALSATGTYTDGSTQNLTTMVTWQAGPSNVAAMSGQGNLKGLTSGVAQVKAAYQSVTGNASVNVGSAVLAGIAVSAPRSTLPLGESEGLVATGTFSNGSTQDLTASVAWQASPANVASISAQGNLSGVGQGLAQIAAAYQGVNGNASVTVGSAALLSLSVSPAGATVPVGKSQSLIATGNFSDGSKQNLTQAAAWSSSLPTTVSVDSPGSVSGKATGAATITAAVGSINGAASLTVTAPVIVSVAVNPSQSSLFIGTSGQMQAVATFSDGSTQDVTATATWTSQEPSIASAFAGGVVLAQQVGTATVQAADGGFNGSATLSVSPMMLISYFSRINTVNSKIDGTLRIVDPGYTQGDMCAMIYVFDQNQEMNECCGCEISADGLLTLSLLKDLTANPLTGVEPNAGDIEIIPANLGPGGTCNAGLVSPNSMLTSWETNVQGATGQWQLTESTAAVDILSPTEQQVLVNSCGLVQNLGSGTGICSCGTGD